jgi:CubicO group peptidase (beta-lactamase class C family)
MESGSWLRVLASAAAFMFVSPLFAKPADLDARLSEAFVAIDRAVAASSAPGLVVGITDRTHLRKIIVHGYADVKARKPLTADSRFALGSISKSFTAVALMQLSDEGRFDPQAPITRYLPSLTLASPFGPITARHLLSHTAGLPNYLVNASSSRYAAIELREFQPTYAPGTHFWYSNTGFQLLGYVLENIEAKTYPAIIQRRVLDRLGMTSSSAVVDGSERARMAVSYVRWPYDGTYVEAPWFEYAAGDGSIVSNATDMCAYLRFILNRGVGADGRVLSDKAFTELTTPLLHHYAYGLSVRREDGGTVISHNGSIAGFSNDVEAHMDEGFAVVFLSNGGFDSELEKWIIQSVAAAYQGVAPPLGPAHEQDRDEMKPQEYAGVYRVPAREQGGAGDSLEFIAFGKQLLLKSAHGGLPLERMGQDTFRISGSASDGLPFLFGRAQGPKDDNAPKSANAGKAAKVIEVSHGAHWYVTADFVDTPAPEVGRHAAFVGHFENNGPEGPVARLFVRNGRLMLMLHTQDASSAHQLESVSEGVFRLVEPAYAPERLRFDTLVEGRALRLSISGVPLYRKDTP